MSDLKVISSFIHKLKENPNLTEEQVILKFIEEAKNAPGRHDQLEHGSWAEEQSANNIREVPSRMTETNNKDLQSVIESIFNECREKRIQDHIKFNHSTQEEGLKDYDDKAKEYFKNIIDQASKPSGYTVYGHTNENNGLADYYGKDILEEAMKKGQVQGIYAGKSTDNFYTLFITKVGDKQIMDENTAHKYAKELIAKIKADKTAKKEILDKDKSDFIANQDENKVLNSKQSPEAVHSILTDWMKQIKTSITGKVKNSIVEYEDEFYSDVNNYLRGKNEEFDNPNRGNEMMEAIDKAMSKATLPFNITVYRGVRDPTDFINIEEGAVFTDKAFVSTSINKDTAQNYVDEDMGITQRKTGAMLVITVPKGTNCLYMPSIVGNTDNASENELLLNRGLKFEVTSMEQNGKVIRCKVVSGRKNAPGRHDQLEHGSWAAHQEKVDSLKDVQNNQLQAEINTDNSNNKELIGMIFKGTSLEKEDIMSEMQGTATLSIPEEDVSKLTMQKSNAFYNELKDNNDFKSLCKTLVGNQPNDEKLIKNGVKDLMMAFSWHSEHPEYRPIYLATMLATQNIFGLPNNYETNFKESANAGQTLYDNNKAGFDSFINGMYNITQQKLKEAGVKDVVVYRGFELTDNKFGKNGVINIDAKCKPYSSFSYNYKMAASCSDGFISHLGRTPAVIACKVPAERILCTSTTGFGTHRECEVVVLGGNGNAILLQGDIPSSAKEFAQKTLGTKEAKSVFPQIELDKPEGNSEWLLPEKKKSRILYNNYW